VKFVVLSEFVFYREVKKWCVLNSEGLLTELEDILTAEDRFNKLAIKMYVCTYVHGLCMHIKLMTKQHKYI